MKVDFSAIAPTRAPTRREASLYRAWRAYLRDSRLTPDEQHRRAAHFAEQGKKVPA